MVSSNTTSITPAQHADRHVIGGADPLENPLLLHSSRHETGGDDEVTPISHASSHEAGGSDVVDVTNFGTMSDVTGSRATDTTYRNTTGKPMFVNVSGHGTTTMSAQVSATTPASGTVARSAHGSTDDSLSFVVPNNYYYRVWAMINIDSWVEWA